MNWLYFAFGMVAGVLCSVAGAVWLAFAGTATQNQITKEMSQQRKQQSGK